MTNAQLTIASGIKHQIPADLRTPLLSNWKTQQNWNSLTPIQRNEWICWVTYVKKPKTRANHIQRLINDVTSGKKNPCCWAGCPHRNPNARKWFKS